MKLRTIKSRGYKNAAHEILNAHNYKNTKKFRFFSGLDTYKPIMLFSCP